MVRKLGREINLTLAFLATVGACFKWAREISRIFQIDNMIFLEAY